MAVGTPKSGTLGAFNVGLATSVATLVPLGAQVDALIAAGIGPFQEDLSARLNAAVSASATLSVAVGNPFAGIQSVLMSLSGIQQALQLALQYPTPTLQYSEQLSTLMALSGTLAAELGALQQVIQQSNQIKTAALRGAADLSAGVNAGPAFFFDFNGSLGAVGGELASLCVGGLIDGTNTITPTQQVYGIVLLSSVPSVQTALSAIIKAP
jgi:hypothetical protein